MQYIVIKLGVAWFSFNWQRHSILKPLFFISPTYMQYIQLKLKLKGEVLLPSEYNANSKRYILYQNKKHLMYLLLQLPFLIHWCYLYPSLNLQLIDTIHMAYDYLLAVRDGCVLVFDRNWCFSHSFISSSLWFLYDPQRDPAICTAENISLETGTCLDQRGYTLNVYFGNESFSFRYYRTFCI